MNSVKSITNVGGNSFGGMMSGGYGGNSLGGYGGYGPGRR